MEIPESMKAELASWNNDAGIDLKSWVGCVGNFSLAVGYGSIFWPEFVEFGGYILRKGFSETALRGFASREGSTRKSVESVMNHLHIEDIQHLGCEDISKDKLLLLGNLLREIHEAKLKWQFPDKTCVTELLTPETLTELFTSKNQDDLTAYQVTFWQR